MARSSSKVTNCFEVAVKGIKPKEFAKIESIAEGEDFKTLNVADDYARATQLVLDDLRAQRAQALQTLEAIAPEAAKAYAPVQEAPAADDDLDAMFDDIVAQESAQAAPKAPRAPRAPSTTPSAPRAPRTAGQAAKSAVKNAASGIGNTIDALGALFSTKPGTLGSGPVFNEDTYAAAKPLFTQAVADLKASGQDIREVMQAVIRMVMAKFGGDTVAQMKPYIVKFTQDVRDGLIDVSQSVVENGETNGDTENKENQDDSGIEGESAGALDELSAEQVGGTGGRGSRGSGANGSRNSRRKGHSSVDGEGGKAGRGRGNGTAEPDLFAAGEGRNGDGPGKSGGIGPDGSGLSGNEGQGSQDRQGSSGGIRTGSGEVIPAAVPATNFVITPDLNLGAGGEVGKYNGNLAAIRTLKTIESEHRRATPDEQRILAKFVGWGGLSKAFRNRLTGEYNKEWLPRVQELEALLTPAELKAASASTPNAHYTSETVTGFMWRAAKRLGFGGGMALESSVGSGNFIGLMPEHVRAGTFLTGIELDSITARIAGALYPQSNIVHSAFEKVALPDNTFDLNIGNPPFGAISLRMKYNPKHNGKSIHNQFFLGGMDALKPGGLQAMVVSRYLMDAQDASTREALALKAELLGAIRLPGSAFKGNAGTDVVTDILFLKKRTAGEQAELQDLWNARGAKPPAKESYSDRAERLDGQARLAQALDWTTTAKVADPLGGEAMQVSKYFADNPHMIAGVMDRSGSMQYGGDIDVKLPASELEAKLDSLMAKLPEVTAESRSDEVNARTEAMHKALGESMSIMASGREIGSIYYDESGDLTEIAEKVDEQGKTVVSKMKITAQSPWSSQLSLNMDGKWFKEVAALDEKGEKVKVGVKINPKTGKPTPGRNLYVREVYQNDSDVPSGMRLGEEGFAKLQRLVAIRELYVQQINLETNSAQPEVMEANRAKLRAAYEGFVADHGYINEQKNASIVSDMPDEGLLLSLELKFRPAVTAARAKAKGIKASPARAEPNAILTRAVSIPPARKDSAASISDAVAIVLGEMGRIDVPRVAQLRAISEEQATKDMTEGDAPIAYLDPETREITEKNQYLSGNVRKKLAAAIAANMQTNIKALEAVQPEPWTSDKVTAHMGATWVPPNIYADFVKHLLGRDAKVTFSPLTNLFEVIAPGATAVDSSKWGTERAKAVDLLNAILNNTRIAIYDGGYKDVPRVLNETDTQSAIDKKKELLEEFDNWIFKDGDRRQELTQLFNDLYNTRVNRQYDGAHMEFPGKVPDSIIKFRRNQINAVWRGIVDRFVMYDHAVGAGKTFTGISRAIERRRMGLSNKPAVVVPNHLVSEWATQAYRLYPGAKILAASKKDLEPKNRRRLFAKIAAGDWDLVIVPHSSFKFIGISPETEERFINDELRVANAALKEAEDDADPGQRFKPLSVKAAEALILKLENRMDVVRGKAGKDQLLTFEQMGIDDLTVDESHEFKNLTYSTRLTDVRGLGPAAGSQKAFDLYTKMRILHETNGSSAFLTGTPISNSAVEMYTIMRYLAPSVLQESGLEHFDAFRAQYVQASEKHEPTEAGNGLKVVNRLGRNWSNMRSLMDGYYSVADVVTNDDIKVWFSEDNPGREFPMPKVKGGGRRTVKADPTPTQQRLIQEVIDGYNSLPFIEDVKDRNKERLRLMDRARKLALHAKAWDRNLTDEPGGKLDMVVDEAMRLYKQWGDQKGTQLIFLDRSVPKAQGDDQTIKAYDALRAKLSTALENEDEKGQREAIEALESYDTNEIAELRAAQAGGWNAYQHMADGLIAKGVPKEQIAFIQNYTTDLQKKALFEAVNDGTIRFLFGSSQRMGAGMNVQERLVGLHHVDVSWKPSDIEQREGRIIRQGNRLAYNEDGTPNIDGFEVEIMAYVTERSMDAKMWDLNATKLRMVNGIRYYDGEFEMDFEDDDAIDMAEIAAIASGDPLMLERIKLTSTLEELYRKRKSYDRRVQSAEDSLRRAERNLVELPIAIAKAKAIAEPVNEAVINAQADQLGRSISVDGEKFTNLESALGHAEEQIKIKKDGDEKAPFTLDVDGTPLSSVDKVREAIADKMGDVAAFVAELGGKKVIRRATVAREIRALIGTEFRDMAPTTFGSMYGFRMTVSSDYGRFNSHNVNLSVTIPYAGKVETVMLSRDISPEKHKSGQAVPVLTSSLRAVVDQLANKIESLQYAYTRHAEEDLASAKENIPTYREAMKEKFKFADELDAANTRLDEVQDILADRADAKKNAPAVPAVEDEVKIEDGEAPAFSRATGQSSDQDAALKAFSEADDLFALPKSKSKDIEQIARDNGENIKVRTGKVGSETLHTITFESGVVVRIFDRPASPYGNHTQIYAMDLVDGNASMTQIGRPGENPEDVPETDDVYLDVSMNTPAKYGSIAYNIAATYAHNNGRIFIGDPNGLTDPALRRRTEQMLSSALKFGTTDHLAPHPKQVAGAAKLGVPPLKWIYGDHVGNIERMIDVSLESLENGAPGSQDDTHYDQSTGGFTDKSGQVVQRKSSMGRDMASYRDGVDKAQAGWRTYARSAFLRSFLGDNGRAEGSGILGRAINDVSRISGNGVGGGAYPRSERIFYSRGGVEGSLPVARVTSIVDAIRATWKNAPDIVVASSMDDEAIPASVRAYNQKQMSLGATGAPQGFIYGGKVYLIADQLSTPGHVVEVLFHEALGHIGLRGVFGKSLDQVLNQVILARRSEVLAKAKQYGLSASNPAEMRQAAEEVLAEMAQAYPELGIVQRAIAAIRTWLRTNIPQLQAMKLTDAEIVRNFLMPARRFVTGGDGDGPNGGLAFSLGENSREHDFQPLANQSTAKALNDTLVRYGLGQDWSNAYEAVKLPDALFGVRKAFQAAFGRDVRPVAPTAAKFNIFNGVYIPSHPNAVYVNVASEPGFINIAGHELWHIIKRQRPDLIDWYREKSRQFYKDLPAYRNRLNALLQEGEKEYTSDKAEEELEADFMGDSLTDTEFLQSLADASPSKFKALLSHVQTWLEGVIGKLKGLGSTKEVTDVKALQGYLKDVLIAFADSKAIPSPNESTAPDSGGAPVAQTETQAFKKWFGDSAVVDAAGKPLVVYHGSNTAGITEFNTDAENNDGERGTFFSEKKSATKDYGDQVYETYISIQNPYVVTSKQWAMGDGLSPSKAREAGHDGYIIRGLDGKNGDAFMAFAPTQIKSANGNNGDFDGTNPDIRFSRSATLSATANKVVDKLNEHFSHPGTMSWWHKSFGSPYNLAQKSRPFKRVFTSAQDFLNDVSFYANEAADHAAKLLPKLESWKDIGKSPISAADNKAIEAPIFEGTLIWARDESGKAVKIADLEAKYDKLGQDKIEEIRQKHKAAMAKLLEKGASSSDIAKMEESHARELSADEIRGHSDEAKAQMLLRKGVVTEAQLKRWKASQLDIYSGAIRNRFEATFLRPGVVWSDAELKSIFNLTPDQADLYRQFHAAVGTSLDNMAKSEMLRYGGKDVADLRDMVLDAPTADDAAILLRDHLLEMAEEDESRSGILSDMANGMVDRADKVNKLKKEGYAPLSRFGQYSVDVVVDGERQYFGLFETMADANQMAAKMREEFGADNVESGTVAQAKFELYKGITPESLELFGNMLGLDSTGDKESDKAFQEYLKLTKNNRSAMKRMIHRQGIAGYSTDTGRVLAAFIYSNARQTAAGLHMGEMSEALEAMPKLQGQLSDYATKYADYVKNPQEEAQAIRGLMFAQYLGGNVASAFVNFTQPMTVSFPYLSQFAGVKGAAAAIGKAMADQRKAEYDDDLKEALRIADEQGVTQPQSVHELQAQARGAATLRPGDGTRRGDAVAMASNAVSKFSLGWGKLFGMAEQINRRTTFIAAYRIAVEKGIANPSAFATKAVDETQFINNKGNRASASRGAIGSTAMTFKSYSINYMELLHRMATQGGPEGKRAVAYAMVMLFLMAGAGGLPFMEDLDDLIDGIAQRMGYNFSTKKAKQEFLEHWIGKAGAQFVDRGLTGIAGVPIDVAGRMGMGNLLPGTGLFMPKADHSKDLLEFAGVGADMAKRVATGAGQFLDGRFIDSALTVAPKAIGNAAQGIRMGSKGYYEDSKGAKVIDTTPTEAVFKSIGFQPQSVALVGQSNWINQSAKNLYTLNAQAIRAQWAKGIFENDPDQVNDARERMRSWNEKNPGLRIDPNMPAIIKKVREMRKTKEERIADTAPKAMRAQLRKDIAENAQ